MHFNVLVYNVFKCPYLIQTWVFRGKNNPVYIYNIRNIEDTTVKISRHEALYLNYSRYSQFHFGSNGCTCFVYNKSSYWPASCSRHKQKKTKHFSILNFLRTRVFKRIISSVQ